MHVIRIIILSQVHRYIQQRSFRFLMFFHNLFCFHSHFIAICDNLQELLGQVELLYTHENACHRFYVDSEKRLNIDESIAYNEVEILIYSRNGRGNLGVVLILDGFGNIRIFPGPALVLMGLKSSLDAAVYMDTGTGNNGQIISIDKVCKELGAELCSAIIGFHSFSGKHFLIVFNI